MIGFTTGGQPTAHERAKKRLILGDLKTLDVELIDMLADGTLTDWSIDDLVAASNLCLQVRNTLDRVLRAHIEVELERRAQP